ncbi:DsbA family protein [Natronobiforma cellulositropha]|uniref:DsbA family protein n=1 Tax=Natronobiforma cellulositropha TaxID=1679076 RepID=UPI0021D60A04|nr:DsbA family protein [Natronobiforma cellulositropha]
MNRRTFLTVAAGAGCVALAGCTSDSGPEELDDVDGDGDGVGVDPDEFPRPALGSGPVTVDVYEDLACPFCHQFEAQVFPSIESDLIDTGEITYRYFDFPIPVDEDRSVDMANAARAVQAETYTDDEPAGDLFAYKAAVFRTSDWSDSNLVALAEDVGVDGDAVASALEEGTYYPVIEADRSAAVDRGVTGTPTVFVEDERIEASSLQGMYDGIVETVESN